MHCASMADHFKGHPKEWSLETLSLIGRNTLIWVFLHSLRLSKNGNKLFYFTKYKVHPDLNLKIISAQQMYTQSLPGVVGPHSD